jgi:5-methylcytosine-specific restriction endonuclease McrA
LTARLDAVRLLSLDAHGRVLDWISWQDATCLYARGAVAWTWANPASPCTAASTAPPASAVRSHLHPIIAARGHARGHALDPDAGAQQPGAVRPRSALCLYCGKHFPLHCSPATMCMPLSRGGRDIWENVVTACFHCNSRKGGRTPQQASMPLLAVPYRPSWIEHLILSNRNILADQMAFLKHRSCRRIREARRSRVDLATHGGSLRLPRRNAREGVTARMPTWRNGSTRHSSGPFGMRSERVRVRAPSSAPPRETCRHSRFRRIGAPGIGNPGESRACVTPRGLTEKSRFATLPGS